MAEVPDIDLSRLETLVRQDTRQPVSRVTSLPASQPASQSVSTVTKVHVFSVPDSNTTDTRRRSKKHAAGDRTFFFFFFFFSFLRKPIVEQRVSNRKRTENRARGPGLDATIQGGRN